MIKKIPFKKIQLLFPVDIFYSIRLISGLFILSILAGVFSAQMDPTAIKTATSALGPIVDFLAQLSWWQIILFIFLNNTLTISLAIFGGLALGILPLGFLIFNGYLIGVVTQVVSSEFHFSLALVGILPHGILEISALILAAALGVNLGQKVWLGFRGGEWEKFNLEFKQTLYLFFIFIIPALILAAIIEVLITPIFLFWLCPECLAEGIIGGMD